MSQKIPVDNIEEATRAFDTKTQQYVLLHHRIPGTHFFVAEPYDDDKYIIVSEYELTELHTM